MTTACGWCGKRLSNETAATKPVTSTTATAAGRRDTTMTIWTNEEYDHEPRRSTRQRRLDDIADEPRGTKFYCPVLARYGYSKREARRLVRQGYQVISEDRVTIPVRG